MSQAQQADASGIAGMAGEAGTSASSGVSSVPTPPESLVPGVVDLLGVLAYGELSAFDQMAKDARHAPTLAGRTALSQMAAAEMGHFRMLAAYLEQAGVDVEDAMRPVVRPIEAFHDSTAPHSWLESLVKAHVGDGLAADLYREVAEWLDPASRELVFAVLADTGSFRVRRARGASGLPGRPEIDRPACALGPAVARRGDHAGPVRGRRTGRAGRTDRHRVR